MERFSALIGFFAILLIAYLLSTNRRAIRWRTVGWGLVLQIVTAVLVLKGALISSKLAGLAPTMSRAMASAIFLVLAIVIYQIAIRIPAGTRRVLSGGFMAAYVLVAKVDVIHLLTAVIMTAPGAIMMAKLIVPETEQPKTGGDVEVVVPKQDVNIIDAAGRGAIEGLHLSLNVAGMLIAFIALVALVNGVFGWANAHLWFSWRGQQLSVVPGSLDVLLGFIFRPIAWAMGVSWKDRLTVRNLLGTRMVLNEFVAFAN